MRILHVSDTHLGMRRPVRGGPAGWSRADDHLQALAAAVELAGEVDLVVHTGDLYDRSRPPRRAVAAAARLLTGLARHTPVVVLAGNHDRRGLKLTVPLTQRDLHVVDQADRIIVGDLALAVVPYLSDARGWAAAARRAVGPGADLLLCHQAVDGCRVPGFTFRVGRQRDTLGPQHLPTGPAHVLCGHIHPRQVVALGDATVVMPGSTERTSFSERRQTKGAAIWELGRTTTWRWLDLPTRPMRVVGDEDDLAAVRPGDLVRTATSSPDLAPELDAACLARGGFITGPPPGSPPPQPRPPRRQLGLF